MILQLLAHYLRSWLFVAVHALLIAAAIRAFIVLRQRLARHIVHLRVQLAHRASGAPDIGEPPAGADEWAVLLGRHREPRPPGFTDVREHYQALIGGYLDDLGRVANILLLSGVAGTLYGLYGSASHANAGAAGGGFGASFDAFGVTIVALVLAAAVLLLQRRAAHSGDAAMVSISLAWDRARVVVEDDPTDAATIVAHALRDFQGTLTPVLAELEHHSQRIAHDREGLESVAKSCDLLHHSCALLAASFEQLPAKLNAGMDGSLAGYLQGLQQSADALRSHEERSVDAVRRIVTIADEQREQHTIRLHALGAQHVELFAQVRQQNQETFEATKVAVFNLAARVRDLDGDLGKAVAGFGERVTELLARQLVLLEGKLAALLDVVPDVDRNLQQLRPSVAVVGQSLASLEASAVAVVGQVNAALDGLAGTVRAMDAQVRRATQSIVEWRAPAPPVAPPEVPRQLPGGQVTLVVAAGMVGAALTWVLTKAT